MTTSTLSQSGQTTIPAKVRQFLRIAPSDKLVYRFEGEKVMLEAARPSTESLYGCLRTTRKAPTRGQLHAARKTHYARKYGA